MSTHPSHNRNPQERIHPFASYPLSLTNNNHLLHTLSIILSYIHNPHPPPLTHPPPIRILIIIITPIMAETSILQPDKELVPARPLDPTDFAPPALCAAHASMPRAALVAAVHQLGAPRHGGGRGQGTGAQGMLAGWRTHGFDGEGAPSAW